MKSEIIIVGAGAAGLMAARELSKAGKKVLILEARNRIGGRIEPLDWEEFDYPAQAGGEFVHGGAPVTRGLIKEAGLQYLSTLGGKRFVAKNGKLTASGWGSDNEPEDFQQKLKELKADLPIAKFLNDNFGDEKYAGFRRSIIGRVEGYEAGDANRLSTFMLRESWLSDDEVWDEQGRIQEGYGALLNFLVDECHKNHVEILLNKKIKTVEWGKGVVSTEDEKFECEKIIVTLPIPLLSEIIFNPEIPDQMAAANKIGFGGVVKIILQFKDAWWLTNSKADLSKMSFLGGGTRIPTWWTQYPNLDPVLVGWIGGPNSFKYKDAKDDEILDLAFTDLSEMFGLDKEVIKSKILKVKVANWPADPLAKGAYSYSTFEDKDAYLELKKSIDDKLYFAGEAIRDKDSATVEGALASGKEVADKILNK